MSQPVTHVFIICKYIFYWIDNRWVISVRWQSIRARAANRVHSRCAAAGPAGRSSWNRSAWGPLGRTRTRRPLKCRWPAGGPTECATWPLASLYPRTAAAPTSAIEMESKNSIWTISISLHYVHVNYSV